MTEGTLRAWLNDLLWLLPALTALAALARWGREMPDALAVATVLAVAGVMSAGIWLRALIRRRTLLASCLLPESAWRQRLRGGGLFWLMSFLRALPLALILVLAVARSSDPRLVPLLVLNAPLLVLIWHWWSVRVGRHALPRQVPDFGWRFAMATNFAILFCVMSALALFSAYPDLGERSLSQAVIALAGEEHARGAMLESFMQLAAAKDAVAWWIGQHFLPGMDRPLFELAGWLVLLATEALVVWSYLVFCSSILAIAHWRAWYPDTEDV